MIDIKKLPLEKLIFFTSLWFSFLISDLYYLSTLSPDFFRYKSYIEYFLFDETNIFSEQGVFYFYFVSIVIYVVFKDLPEGYILDLEKFGNQINFNYEQINELEIHLSNAIQLSNFIIYIVGIVGYYKYFNLKNFQTSNIYLLLSALNFFPPLLQLRLTLKPEILGFSLLIWIIYYFEKFLKQRFNHDLIWSIFLIGILVNTKASIAAMGLILIFFIFLKNRKELINKFILIVTTLLVFSILLFVENFNISDRYIYDRENLAEQFNQLEYDNVATPEVIYNLNGKELFTRPYKNFHNNSFIGITLIDTFGDYFNEYWKKDYLYLSKHNKDFIKSGNNLSIDYENRELTVPVNNLNTKILRNITPPIISIFFYIMVLFQILKNQKFDKILFASPFIGMLILIINSFGFPQNNYNPLTSDTYKVFYYGFLLSISFSIVYISILKSFKKQWFRLFFTIFFIFISLFIIGFPKANNSALDNNLLAINQSSFLCEINKQYLRVALIEYEKKPCERINDSKCFISNDTSSKNEDCGFLTKEENISIGLKNTPFVNLAFLVLIFTKIFYSLIIFIRYNFFRDFR